MYNLNNKVALITGAGKPNGIGKAIALRLAKEGVKIVINDLKSTKKTAQVVIKSTGKGIIKLLMKKI